MMPLHELLWAERLVKEFEAKEQARLTLRGEITSYVSDIDERRATQHMS